MKQASGIFITIILHMVLTHNVMAVMILQCEDEQGNVTYQDRCPPGSKPVDQKDYSVGTAAGSNKTFSGSLILYLVPNCDTCDQVKEFLAVRKITVTEKNVSDNPQLQEELKEKTGGDLRVPVLLIGENVLTGYNRSELLAALSAAGFKEEE